MEAEAWMGGAASQDSYHHGRALCLVIHAEKLWTKTRGPHWNPGSLDIWSSGVEVLSQIRLPGPRVGRLKQVKRFLCTAVEAADAMGEAMQILVSMQAARRQNPPNEYSHLTGDLGS